MRKIILILFLYGFNICNAQVLPDEGCNQGVGSLQTYIQTYQNMAPPATGPLLSYVINTNDIINYFNNTNNIYNSYFHCYFGIDPTDPNNIVRLIIVPTLDFGQTAPNILIHDANFPNAFVPCLYEIPNTGNPLPGQFCYNTDQLDAYNDPSLPQQCPCFSPTVSATPVTCPSMSLSSVEPWILNYQILHRNSYPYPATYPPSAPDALANIVSFTFNANLLRSFLTQSANAIPLLQIYVGIDGSNNIKGYATNYTLIFIGLDNFGNHIPVTNLIGSGSQAYEACRPCPKCGVQPDPTIEGELPAPWLTNPPTRPLPNLLKANMIIPEDIIKYDLAKDIITLDTSSTLAKNLPEDTKQLFFKSTTYPVTTAPKKAIYHKQRGGSINKATRMQRRHNRRHPHKQVK